MAKIRIVYDEQGRLQSVTKQPGGPLQSLGNAKQTLDIIRKGSVEVNPIGVISEQLVVDAAIIKLHSSDHLTEEQKLEFRKILLTTNVLYDSVEGVIENDTLAGMIRRVLSDQGAPQKPIIHVYVDP